MAVQTYKGNCHCGANRFEVQLPDIQSAIECNCSLCAKQGYLWALPPDGGFTMTRGGPETLTTYTSAALVHEFCTACGTGIMGTHSSAPLEGKLAVNIRALRDINPFTLKIEKSDGKQAEEPIYGSIGYRGIMPESDASLKMYNGACHCGAITLVVKSKPLPEVQVKEDNCSICVRIGFIGIYPHESEVSLAGRENTRDYKFGRGFNGHPFCQTCGVHAFSNLYGPPAEVVAKLPPEKLAFVQKQLAIQPVNIRVLEAVEWDELKVERTDEGTVGYKLADEE